MLETEDIAEEFADKLREELNLSGVSVTTRRSRFNSHGDTNDSESLFRVDITFVSSIIITRAALIDGMPVEPVADSLRKGLLRYVDQWRAEVNSG